MSRIEQDENCKTIMDEIALLKEWCKQMKSGTIDNLSAAITEVLGHCENTTKHRINALAGSRVIIVYNNSWKYNPSYNNQGVELMKRLKVGLKSEDEEEQEEVDKLRNLPKRVGNALEARKENFNIMSGIPTQKEKDERYLAGEIVDKNQKVRKEE